MAVTGAKTILFFEQGDYSWSESFHLRRPVDTLHDAIKFADVLALKRMQLLGASSTILSSPRLTGYRLSDDGFRRDSIIRTNLAGSVARWDSPGDWDAVLPYDALLTRAENEDGHWRNFYISSVPSKVYYNRSGIFGKEVGEFADKWGIWAQELQSNWSFPIVQRDPAVAPTTDVINITNVGQIVTITPSEGIGVPQKVVLNYLRFSPGTPKLAGTYQVIAVRGGSFDIRVPGLVQTLDYLSGGYYRPWATASRDITSVKYIKKTHRKRGVHVFKDTRGRSLRMR